jgi:hypothetical protein
VHLNQLHLQLRTYTRSNVFYVYNNIVLITQNHLYNVTGIWAHYFLFCKISWRPLCHAELIYNSWISFGFNVHMVLHIHYTYLKHCKVPT